MGQVTIFTRRGHDWTDRFPSIRDAAGALPVRTALVDGEAVVEVNGISNFSALQAALGARERPGHKAAHEAVCYAFDLLHLNGVNLTPATLVKRKDALAQLACEEGRDLGQPELIAEVTFRGWTSDDLVRHASFSGLREDKDARQVTREQADGG